MFCSDTRHHKKVFGVKMAAGHKEDPRSTKMAVEMAVEMVTEMMAVHMRHRIEAMGVLA
jgi:hypothetical protein